MIKKSSNIFSGQIISNIILAVFSLFCILPLVLVFSISLSDERSIASSGYSLIPENFTWFAYEYVMNSADSLFRAYGVTIFVTVVGTVLSVIVTALLSYPLSRSELRFRRPVLFYVFFTMLFNGGLVPWYILITQYLHMKDQIFVLIVPYLVSAWNVLLMRNFFRTIPESIMESARIDGAGEWRIFFKIVSPLSLPSFATIALLNSIAYWNDWWLGLLFIENRNLFPLQLLLQSVLSNLDALAAFSAARNIVVELPGETARMALCILAIGPIIIAYPFLQRYFVKGLSVGAVKE
ncbi:putative aldouronate transport system permease protein [Paenibacillus castaneae]|uniref:carbohydrate ABC transporter permease n=1 Tax=Paenibacillus castaneae TaxID=474957 RepID=UPI000C9B052C|nr:carbohydrate ABC transporter permease [Paenibacillus castaneae]NIK78743.1 putative aldouronate transport system permease protein [Paenibacillus castaneae]